MVSAVGVLLVGEKVAMARLKRLTQRALPECRLTVVSTPTAFQSELGRKPPELVILQEPAAWTGEDSPARVARQHWPGCVILWLLPPGHQPGVEAALRAGVDSTLIDSLDLPDMFPFRVRLELARAAERAARLDSESSYRSMFDHLPVGMYRTSPQGEILDANQELVRMLGYPDRPALLASKASELYVRPPDRRRILSRHQEADVLSDIEVELRRADGTTLWVEDHARPLRDSAGRIVAYEGTLLDITRRKQAETALRSSEERFRALVQNATDIIATLNPRGRILSVTPSAERVLGYAPGALVGRDSLDLIHPDDAARAQQALARTVQRTNLGLPIELRLRHADGAWVVLEAVGNNLLDQPGIGAIVLTARAVTERKQAEAALRESERRLSTLLGNLPGMAYRCRNDPDWTMEFVSHGCLALTGYQADDLLGNRTLSYASLIHPDDQAQVWREVQAAVKEGRPFQLTYRIATAQGGFRWVWEQGGVAVMGDDGVERLEGFIADISDQRAAEEDLRASRAWLQHVVETVDDLLVVYDREGRYVDIITRQASLLLRPATEMLGRTVLEILPQETARRFLAGIRIILTQGSPYEFEYPLELPDGVRWFRARGRRIRGGDEEPDLTLWAISDITESQAAEQAQLHQSRQLEILSRTSQQLNAVLETPVVLRTLVAAGMELVAAAAGAAGLWSDDRMRFTEYNHDGLLQPIEASLAVGEGVPGIVAKTCKAYIANEPVSDRALAQAGEGLSVRNLINVPILSRDGLLLGCLEVHNKREGQAFDEADVSMLEGLASSAAVALENAQLLQERLRAEAELRLLKEFNEDIVLSMGEGIVVQDRKGNFTFVNPAAAGMLGYSPEELRNVPWTKVVPPDQHAIVRAVDAERTDGVASRYEVEFVRKDGSRLPALVSGSPRFKEGRFEGMLAVFADISDRKAAERALQESEEQFRSVAERSPSMIFINQGGRIVYVNLQGSAAMGYRPEELLADGFGYQQLVAPDSMPIVQDAWVRHARGEDVAPYEYELVTRDGRLLTVINATKLITFRGAPAILGVVTDITERKRAEEELRSERDFSNLVINSLPGVFYMYDEDGRTVRWNRRAEEALGFSGDEIGAMRAGDFFVGADRTAVIQTLGQVLETGQAEGEAAALTKDGRRVPFYFTGVRATFGDRNYVIGVGIDITDRLRAEEALRASEARFRAFFEHAAIGIALTDEAGQVLESNVALQAMFGLGASELERQSQWGLIHADDAGLVQHLYAELCQGRRGPYQIETRYRHADGRDIPTRLTVSRVPGGDTQAVTAVWMVEDITERQRAEEALRQSERRFRLLVERAADAVFLHDLEGRILDVNHQACESLGYSREELLHLSIADIEVGFSPEASRQVWEHVRAGGPLTMEGVHRRKDGQTLPVELRVGSFDVDERPFILALVRDIRQRREAEEALRETTAMLQALVEAAPVGVAVLGLDGRVRLWNPAAERIFGVSAAEIAEPGLPAWRRMQVNAAAGLTWIQEQLIQGETVSGVELRTTRASGEPVDVSLSAAPLRDAGGRIHAVMGVLADVTDRKRAEAAIERHAREMSMLYETSLEVAETSDPMEILRRVVARAAQLLGAPMGGVYLMDDATQELELVVAHNLPPEYLGRRLRLGEGLSGKIAASGEAMVVNDYSGWGGRHSGYDEAGFRRVVGAPLRRGAKVIGVINVTDDKRTDPFEEDEVRILQLFADQAAIALENARLLEETGRRATRLEAVTSFAAALRATRTRKEAMVIVAEHLRELVRADGVLLALEDRATRETVIDFADGVWSDLGGSRRAGAEGVLGQVLASGAAVMVSHASEDPQTHSPFELDRLPALALVSLVDQEHVLGVLAVGRTPAFGEGDKRLLMALVEVVGNALRRAAVLETLEERVRARTHELASANLRLTELDRLKSDFVSNVSHELRTPITNVLLYLDLLQQPGREERRETYMQVLRRESNRLGHLIEDLLTLSRMDQAALKINRELRALDPLLAEIVTAHRARAQAKGIDLTLEPNTNVPPIWIGYQPMTQVFNNLVGNAVAYTPAGGHVILTSLVRRRLGGGTEVGARVRNDSPPIPAEDIPRLFQRFFRGKTGRESGEPGTGLGLAICKEIVDRHGGRIDVESSEEKGTSFTVWLPVGEPE